MLSGSALRSGPNLSNYVPTYRPAVITNIKKEFDNPKDLDGFDELP